MVSYVYGDNVASLFLAKNNAIRQRTKHIHVREKFMNTLVEDGLVELRHVRSEENAADINSKNTKIETHQKLAKRIYEGLPIAIREDSRELPSSKEDVGYSLDDASILARDRSGTIQTRLKHEAVGAISMHPGATRIDS